jgi:hypothetical protein
MPPRNRNDIGRQLAIAAGVELLRSAAAPDSEVGGKEWLRQIGELLAANPNPSMFSACPDLERRLLIAFGELQPSPYLDLVPDREGERISRKGWEPQKLTRPLLWRILDLLIEARGELVPYRTINQLWGGDGPSQDCARDTAKYELNQVLKKLGVIISCSRGWGWYLKELQPDR